MWELDHKEGWPQNCGVGEKSWEYLEHKEIKPVNPKGNQYFLEYSLEGLMLKLKLQHFGHLMWRANVLKNTLMLGNIEGRRRRGQWKIRWLNGTTNSMDMNSGKLWEMVRDQEVWCAAIHGFTELGMTCWLNNTDNGSVEAVGFFFLQCLEFFLL